MKIRLMLTGIALLTTLQSTGGVLAADDQTFEESITVRGAARGAISDYLLTFSTPVALPGLSLAPGTYRFRQPLHNVVQVATASGDPYWMFITIPASRSTSVDRYSIVMGPPVATGAPRRIVAMFGPGETTGRQFVYPER